MELRERLRLALGPGSAQQARHCPSPGGLSSPRALESIPGLRPLETALGTVHVAVQSWPLAHRHGRWQLGWARELDDSALRRLAPGLRPDELGHAAFVDVETTGLAGGTGTYVFLVGVGAFGEDAFAVQQFFLADVAGERAMLAAVAEALGGRPLLVSFNGRRFDLPLLLTRLTLNRQRAPTHGEHVDLLYPARRLYGRRLESCALAALETSILGVRRSGDVPGSLVPSIYFDYLRTGNAASLRGVFEHNALDILSLVTLLAHLGQVCGGDADGGADDFLALGHWDQYQGRLPEAIVMYRVALKVAQTQEQRSTARRRLAHLYRRLGSSNEAVGLWREEARRGSAEGKVKALVELAKVEEHERRDFVAAEALVQRALNLLDVATARSVRPIEAQLRRDALEHRLGRVQRRLTATGRNRH